MVRLAVAAAHGRAATLSFPIYLYSGNVAYAKCLIGMNKLGLWIAMSSAGCKRYPVISWLHQSFPRRLVIL